MELEIRISPFKQNQDHPLPKRGRKSLGPWLLKYKCSSPGGR
jgi:hypothetical protein